MRIFNLARSSKRYVHLTGQRFAVADQSKSAKSHGNTTGGGHKQIINYYIDVVINTLNRSVTSARSSQIVIA
jgi:hypothetical protein